MSFPFSQLRIALVLCVLSVPSLSLSGAPTAPTNLTATSLKATAFTLKWTAATGATNGISGYDIARDGAYLGSTTTRSFAVTGLAPETNYSLAVTARDGAGNSSPASTALIVTTLADATKPTRPGALTATDVTTTSFLLNWPGSSDDVGVTGYTIYRAGVPIGSTTVPTFNVIGLAPDKNHRMTVRAFDAAGNKSAASPALVVRTLAYPPATPTGLTATNVKATSFTLKWTASTGGTGGIAGYDLYRNGTLIGSTAGRSFAVIGLAPLTPYNLTVAARDTADHVSQPSAPLVVTTPADTTKPTAPTNLNASNVAGNSFTLGWTASTDNVGVATYDIYRNGVLFGSTTATSHGLTGLAAAVTYSMKLKARDAAGNTSAFSAVLPVTTGAIPNAPPSVVLNAPLDGAVFTVPAALTLSALATDSDGSVARVEFYHGASTLGDTTQPASPSGTFTLPTTLGLPGQYVIVARAFDNRGASTDSTPIQIRLLAGLPYLADFEAGEGYQPGSLHHQLGWTVPSGTAQIVTGDAAHGEQSVSLSAGTAAALAGQQFGQHVTDPPVAFIDLQIKPAASADPLDGTLLDFEAIRLGCVLNPHAEGEATPAARFFALIDDGSGGESWSPLPAAFPLGAGHVALDWQRVSLRIDSAARHWDFYLNGQLVAANLPFRPGSADHLTAAIFRGHAAETTGLDDLYVGPDNPVFVDADHDGMDDVWEISRGLSPGDDDRNGDLDGDSLTNIQEFLLGTNPAGGDSDGDSLSDEQELARGTDPTKADTDSDGLPDGWELNQGFNPLSDEDASADPDGDGLTTLQEFVRGSSPVDYYNGALPTITSLLAGDGSLGPEDTLRVLVTDATGHPLPNAPVRFNPILGEHRVAAALDGESGFNVTVTTDATGIATVFLKAGSNNSGPTP